MSSSASWQPSGRIDRDFDRIDMFVTAYSILRDRYRRWALYLNLSQLVAGTGLVLLSFGTDQVSQFLGISSGDGIVIVGLLGAIVFVGSLVEVRVDWHGRSALYGWAAERFAELKLEYGSYLDGPTKDDVREGELRGQYQSASAVAPRIPEGMFLPLKQAHLKKVALSRMISKSPGTPLLILRWRLMRSGKVEK